ncbi:MAG: hypothetical protein IH851_01125 [Armatimonadetes bacterium]|nr:hypothetical protein [Armatimonadota bacterium]
MTRFKDSAVARLTGRTIILAMVWNFLLFALAPPNASAQIASRRSQWAVIDFINKTELGGAALGGTAADAVVTHLIGTGEVDLVSRETVDRAYQEMGLTPPVTNKLSILRLGQFLQVRTVIVGEVQKARINRGGNGKSADVVLVVRGIDMASGLPVMGTAMLGQSSERPGDISDEALLNEAIDFAAQKAVMELRRQQIGVATVLATPSKFVKLNMGDRHGVKVGMRMVVTRGREQVGIIRISKTSPDWAEAVVVERIKGVAPGDRARPIFDELPEVIFTGSRGGKTRTVRRGNTSQAIIAILVVGLLALILVDSGGGNSPGNLTTEAGLAEDGISPVVSARWKPGIFNQGAWNRFEWHIWRTDYQPTAVEVVDGSFTQVLDRVGARTRVWRNPALLPGGTTCTEDPGPDPPWTAPGIVPGTSYMYQLSLIYRVSSLSLPGAEGEEVTDCFFTSSRKTARGQATPVEQTPLILPVNGATDVNNITQFSWQGVPGADLYLVQLSTTPTFSSRSVIKNVVTVETVLGGLVSTDPVDISGIFPGVLRLYWRVGARNSGDVPGPVKDVSGERFVFSRPFQFNRVVGPPPPPSD